MSANDNERAEAISRDPRWAAVLERDRRADGTFVYAVASTGIYCRPGCPARRPSPASVSFYASAAQAEQAGFRPCKRCRPDKPSMSTERTAMVRELCRFIDALETVPTLAMLAERTRLSPFHLHRVFKAVTGMTPRAYAVAKRAERLRLALRDSGSVTEAIYAAGYQSNSRFYAETDRVLGMTPSSYRRAGAGSSIHYAFGECSLGLLLAAWSERGVCAIQIGDERQTLLRELQGRFPLAELSEENGATERLIGRVIEVIDTAVVPADLPLDLRGTAFQQRVWKALQQIPRGETLSYRELARRVGKPHAIRAVASACAANALAVAVPCHRAVRSDGSLAGYRWGIARKRALLEREKDGGKE